MSATITLDGSLGEGGGQILRTALALSLITQKPFRIERIRAGRKKPGLLHQHLTCVQAAAAIGQAQAHGGTLGSRELTFEPGETAPGDYFFSVGTAGSAILVLQTVLPPLWLAGGPSTLTVEGGTHNRAAPPFDFLKRAFFPLIARIGAQATARLDRHGFYPAGGGRCSVTVEPVSVWTPLELNERGLLRERRATAIVSRLPRHIADRELSVVHEELGWPPEDLHVVEVHNSPGPGNALLLELASDEVTEVFTGFGERGIRAEDVALSAIHEARAYLESAAPVGPHLSDQLILPLALAGSGSFRAGSLTSHTTTNIEVVERFLNVRFRVTPEDTGTVMIELTHSR